MKIDEKLSMLMYLKVKKVYKQTPFIVTLNFTNFLKKNFLIENFFHQKYVAAFVGYTKIFLTKTIKLQSTKLLKF